MRNFSDRLFVLIPAKGQSDGLRSKNLAKLGEDSLVDIAVQQGHRLSDHVFVSSESDDVLMECCRSMSRRSKKSASCIKRSAHLSTTEASTYSVVLESLHSMISAVQGPDYVAVLQCTHPFRRVDRILSQLEEFFDLGFDCGFSCSPASNHTYVLDDEGVLIPEGRTWDKRPRRQEQRTRIQDDGSFFISRIDKLAGHGDLIWPHPFLFTGNYCGPDIHTQEDLDIARALWKKEFIVGVP